MDSIENATILTIDDEDSIRQSFVAYLQDLDLTVLEANNGRVGLEIFRKEKPDLVIVDLRMPEVDGLQVLVAIREESPDTPLIVVSGTGAITDVVEAMHLGAWDYLLKPIEDMQMLQHAVGRCLERARLIRENRLYQHNLEEEVRRRTAELECSNKELADINVRLKSIVGAMRGLVSSSEIDAAGRRILETFAQNTSAESAIFYLSDGIVLKPVHTIGLDSIKAPTPLALPLPQGTIFRKAMKESQPVLVEDLARAPFSLGENPLEKPHGSLLVFPLFGAAGAALGVVALRREQNPPFNGHDKEIGGILASYSYEALRAMRATQALRLSEERLDLALRGADLGLWNWNIQTGKLIVNPRWMEIIEFDNHDTELDFQFWNSRVHPDDLPRVRHELDEHLAGRAPFYEMEFRMRAQSGVWKWIVSRGKVVETDADNKPLRVAGTHLDITDRRQIEEERRKLEAQVQHAQKLESLGVLAGGIAHDFNNLLMGVLGNADLALSELSPLSPACDNIREVEVAARRAADLCRQMLAYAGKGKFVIQPVELNAVIKEMGHLLEISLSKGAVLKYSLADNLPCIEADATQLQQIIMNLITNASEAIGEKSGFISIATRVMHCDRAYLTDIYLADDLPEGDYVYLEIADTGCGMDAATRGKIFEPFFTTKFTGRGLGMAAVLGIVRGHHGAIKLYSEPGRGATFKLLFPAIEQTALSKTSPTGKQNAWRGMGTVLLVDDEETVRVVARRMLEIMGFSTLEACDGREAVRIYADHREEITCVLLDLTMPHMDGEETFRELRRMNSNVRVIMSSGYNEQEVTQRFSGKGLAGFIQKPYQSAHLIEIIRQVLEADGENESPAPLNS